MRRRSPFPAQASRVLPLWRRAVVLLAAVAMLALSLLGPAQELCLGDGGHLAIEMRHGACAAGVETGAAGTSDVTPADDSGRSAADAHDVPCSDVSLGTDLQRNTETRTRLPLPQPVPIHASLSHALVAVAASLRVGPASVTAPWRPPTLSHLRSVVIRC